MEKKIYTRKPFEVEAVQVDLKNAEEVAAWCGGTVGTKTVKMLGRPVELPTVEIQGIAHFSDRIFVANVGDFIVHLKGTFRVSTEKKFRTSFAAKIEKQNELQELRIAEEFQQRAAARLERTGTEARFDIEHNQYRVIVDSPEGSKVLTVPAGTMESLPEKFGVGSEVIVKNAEKDLYGCKGRVIELRRDKAVLRFEYQNRTEIYAYHEIAPIEPGDE